MSNPFVWQSVASPTFSQSWLQSSIIPSNTVSKNRRTRLTTGLQWYFVGNENCRHKSTATSGSASLQSCWRTSEIELTTKYRVRVFENRFAHPRTLKSRDNMPPWRPESGDRSSCTSEHRSLAPSALDERVLAVCD